MLAQAAAGGAGSISVFNLISQLGIGGIIVYLFMKEMFTYLKSRDERKKNGSAGTLIPTDIFSILRDIQAMSRDLHHWHNAKDEDQVFVWYVRKSLERQIEKLATAVDKMGRAAETQTTVFEEAMERIIDELKCVLDAVKALKPLGG